MSAVEAKTISLRRNAVHVRPLQMQICGNIGVCFPADDIIEMLCFDFPSAGSFAPYVLYSELFPSLPQPMGEIVTTQEYAKSMVTCSSGSIRFSFPIDASHTARDAILRSRSSLGSIDTSTSGPGQDLSETKCFSSTSVHERMHRCTSRYLWSDLRDLLLHQETMLRERQEHLKLTAAAHIMSTAGRVLSISFMPVERKIGLPNAAMCLTRG